MDNLSVCPPNDEKGDNQKQLKKMFLNNLSINQLLKDVFDTE